LPAAADARGQLVAQRDHGIDACGAPRRNRARRERDCRERNRGAAKRHRVTDRHLVDEAVDRSPEREADDETGPDAGQGHAHAFGDNQPQHAARRRAQRQAKADLAGALVDGVCDDAVDADRRDEQRNAGEEGQQRGVQPRLRGASGPAVRHGRVQPPPRRHRVRPIQDRPVPRGVQLCATEAVDREER
jgi:hypothetical protein